MLRKLPTTFALLLLWLFGPALAQTDGTSPTPSPCPTLLARDVLAPTDSHRVSLVFPLLSNVDPASLGDGDLILYGANGAEEGANFEGFSGEHIPVQPNEAVTDLRIPDPRLVASYTFNGPGGNWDLEDNGLYRVRLAEGAIANRDGRAFPSKFLGGFRCVIEEVAPQTIQPTNTRITFHRFLVGDEIQYLADVTLTFNTPHVRLDWGSLVNDGMTFIADIAAQRIPIPVVPVEILTADEVASNTRPPIGILPPLQPSFTHTYRLGALEPGTYHLLTRVNEIREARNSFTIPTDPPVDNEARVEVDVEMDDDGIWKAHARIKLENPQVRITDPGEVAINGDVIMINATAAITDALDVPEVFEFRYDLGQLSAGPKWLRFFINDHQEDQVDFVVPAVPARVDLAFDTETQPSTATVTIQFRDHFRVVNPRIRRFGNFIILLADSEGPLPILAPLPPAPITLTYDLGDLDPGNYLGAFVMDGHLYEYDFFSVVEETFEAEISPIAKVEDTVTITAKVAFKDPFVLITDPGEPRIIGNLIHINATAERVPLFQPPSGDPQVLEYDLGRLRPGRYQVVYSVNNEFGARAHFAVDEVCEPIPHLAGIRTGEEEGQWFSKVALGLNPRQQVLDWGTVRRSGNEFHVNVTVVCQDSPVLPVPVDPVQADEIPEGFLIDAEGRPNIGGAPIRLVSNLYRLGELEGGYYKFCVHSRGQTLGCHRFCVAGDPPRVELNVADITEE